MITKVVNFFKSKSVIDFLYLVMMIIVVTMIKDMVVSMYRKKGEKRWLDEMFKKKEGFTAGGCGDGTTSTCDRLKFLTCNTNFDKLSSLINNASSLNTLATNATNLNNLATNYGILQKYINADIIDGSGNINTNNKNVITGNGVVHTRIVDTNYIRGRTTVGSPVTIGIQNDVTCRSINTNGQLIEAGDIKSTTGNYMVNGNDYNFYFGTAQRLSFRYNGGESHVGKRLQIIDKKEEEDWNYFSKSQSMTNA